MTVSLTPPTRADLAKIFPDLRTLRAVELLFKIVAAPEGGDGGDLGERVTALEEAVVILQAEVEALQIDVAANSEAIALLQAAITAINGDIVALQGRVTVNEDDIATNVTDIATNASDIVDNAALAESNTLASPRIYTAGDHPLLESIEFAANNASLEARNLFYQALNDSLIFTNKDAIGQTVSYTTGSFIYSQAGTTNALKVWSYVTSFYPYVGSIPYQAAVVAIADGSQSFADFLGYSPTLVSGSNYNSRVCFTQTTVEYVNTTGATAGEVWVNDDILWVSPTIAGEMTNVKPVAPNLAIKVGRVLLAGTSGHLLIQVSDYPVEYTGHFLRTTDFTIPLTSTAYPIPLDTTQLAQGFDYDPGNASRVRLQGLVPVQAKVTATISIETAGVSPGYNRLWFRKNGVDVVGSAVHFETVVVSQNVSMGWVFQFAVGDYIELCVGGLNSTVLVARAAVGGWAPTVSSVSIIVEQC